MKKFLESFGVVASIIWALTLSFALRGFLEGKWQTMQTVFVITFVVSSVIAFAFRRHEKHIFSYGVGTLSGAGIATFFFTAWAAPAFPWWVLVGLIEFVGGYYLYERMQTYGRGYIM